MPDFVVIGGGIAGVAAAAHLAPHGEVTILEMEATLAFHTTGRSAAMFTASYGGQASRPLARASREFLENPPDGSADTSLLDRRGALWIADHDQAPLLADRADLGRKLGADLEMLDASQARELVPALNPEQLAGGLLDASAADLDVAALHQAFVRLARRENATILTSSPVTEIDANRHRLAGSSGEHRPGLRRRGERNGSLGRSSGSPGRHPPGGPDPDAAHCLHGAR